MPVSGTRSLRAAIQQLGQPMKRNLRPWTKDELALLGTLPGAEVADLTGRTFGTVWQERRALGIDQLTLRFRRWTSAEDRLVGTAPDADIATNLPARKAPSEADAPFSSASRPDKLNATASPKIDADLTLSIRRNSLPSNPLRVRLRENFDTLSVYRGSLREQIAHARTARL